MYRLVAIFFLLWTMTDLSVPQVCMADFDVPAFDAGASNDQPAMTASPQSHDTGSPINPYQQDDDCFCCCCHVMPSSFVRVERLKPVSCVEREDDNAVPYQSINAPFHPPRI
jgi:hypothetical protein